MVGGWGEAGVRALAGRVDALVVVDVLSFCTAVDAALARGAEVVPCRWRDVRAETLAREHDALLAHERGQGAYTLSPPTLAMLPEGSRIVLPSPNGATLSLLPQPPVVVLAGCLRNATAVATHAATLGRVGVVPAGELRADGALREAEEDLLGAGAILRALPGPRSHEERAAVVAFERARGRLRETLHATETARELRAMGHPQDVDWAAWHDVSATAPVLRAGRFADAARPGRKAHP